MAIFTNQAQITYNGRTVLSNIAQGEIIDPVSISKTALGSTYRSGDTKAYVVTLTNTSSAALTNVTVTDTLGSYVTEEGTYYPLTFTGPILLFVNGVPSGEITPTQTSPTLTYVIPSLPAGGSVTVVYDTEINSFAPLSSGSEIVNTATASGSGIISPISASETITVVEDALLSVTKAVTPTSVTDGNLTYTITIENSGNAIADTVVLTDTFDPILSDISVTLNGVSLTTPAEYTYDEATGLFTIPSGIISVPAATYVTSPSGEIEVVPGTAVVTVSGTV
ncbi:MAG: DUF11 domain-containing protein [Clostridia bacterium]|nr:DUF11 domain-containing protein [Clostridia bacterium]